MGFPARRLINLCEGRIHRRNRQKAIELFLGYHRNPSITSLREKSDRNVPSELPTSFIGWVVHQTHPQAVEHT